MKGKALLYQLLHREKGYRNLSNRDTVIMISCRESHGFDVYWPLSGSYFGVIVVSLLPLAVFEKRKFGI